MAKKSMIARDVKRAKLVDKYAEKRAELKKRIAAGDMEAMFELNKLPKDSSAVRKRNRCQLDGRPRGYMREFGYQELSLDNLLVLG
jgi:ribosomal protein S14p/S29e